MGGVHVADTSLTTLLEEHEFACAKPPETKDLRLTGSGMKHQDLQNDPFGVSK